MAPKKTVSGESEGAAAGAVGGLRDNELRFIKAVFDNMTQKPDADWSKVAEDLGLKDAKCAKERFRQMSVRHGWRSQTGPLNGSSPVKGGGRKGGVTGPSGDGKVKKPRTPRKGVVKKEETEVKSDSDGLDSGDSALLE